MKLKIGLALIGLLVIYIMLPIGTYGINDVGMNTQDDTNNTGFRAMSLSSDKFIEDATNNNITKDEYILIPAVGQLRDSSQIDPVMLYFMSGWIRTGDYANGEFHGALDLDFSSDLPKHGTSPCGRYDCDDAVLVAPVSGKVIAVLNNKGFERQYAGDGIGDHSSYVKIASDAFEGWSMTVMHLANIPSYIQPGYAIKQGDYIGTECHQGKSTGPHIHFQVTSGDSAVKVNIDQWYSKLALHSSIKGIIDLTNASSTKGPQGWSSADITALNSKPRIDTPVVIPDEVKLS